MAGRGAWRAVLISIMALAAQPPWAVAADLVRLPTGPQIEIRPGEISLLAKTAYFEARSDGAAGMLAVCFVIRNRLEQRPEYFGRSITEIVRSPAQFSVWSPGDRQRAAKVRLNISDDSYVLAMWAALTAVTGAAPDPTLGGTHFYSRSMGKPPSWSRSMIVTARIGQHVFMKESKR